MIKTKRLIQSMVKAIYETGYFPWFRFIPWSSRMKLYQNIEKLEIQIKGNNLARQDSKVLLVNEFSFVLIPYNFM